MKFKLRLASIDEDGQEKRMEEIAVLEKDFKSFEHLGLNLAESKDLLKGIQIDFCTTICSLSKNNRLSKLWSSPSNKRTP
jgi:hypothetical protein